MMPTKPPKVQGLMLPLILKSKNEIMERELKFRVFDKNAPSSLSDIDSPKGSMIPHEYVIQSDYFKESISGRYPIMQYIGIKDYIGKEIYEGDIYAHDFADINNWLVCFENGCFGIKNIGIDGLLSQFFAVNTPYFFIDRHCIGNKFENQELLIPWH